MTRYRCKDNVLCEIREKLTNHLALSGLIGALGMTAVLGEVSLASQAPTRAVDQTAATAEAEPGPQQDVVIADTVARAFLKDVSPTDYFRCYQENDGNPDKQEAAIVNKMYQISVAPVGGLPRNYYADCGSVLKGKYFQPPGSAKPARNVFEDTAAGMRKEVQAAWPKLSPSDVDQWVSEALEGMASDLGSPSRQSTVEQADLRAGANQRIAEQVVLMTLGDSAAKEFREGAPEVQARIFLQSSIDAIKERGWSSPYSIFEANVGGRLSSFYQLHNFRTGTNVPPIADQYSWVKTPLRHRAEQVTQLRVDRLRLVADAIDGKVTLSDAQKKLHDGNDIPVMWRRFGAKVYDTATLAQINSGGSRREIQRYAGTYYGVIFASLPAMTLVQFPSR